MCGNSVGHEDGVVVIEEKVGVIEHAGAVVPLKPWSRITAEALGWCGTSSQARRVRWSGVPREISRRVA
jgi:hypothetical protein